MNGQMILAVIAVIVIIALAFYTGFLLNKINLHKKKVLRMEQQQAEFKKQKIQERNTNIIDSIHFIAKATMQKQCNVSEAAIRLTVLLETLQLEQPIEMATSYPALHAMFEKVKDMPTHEERKAHPVKEIKIMDMKREVFEAEMEQAIIKEAAELATFAR